MPDLVGMLLGLKCHNWEAKLTKANTKIQQISLCRELHLGTCAPPLKAFPPALNFQVFQNIGNVTHVEFLLPMEQFKRASPPSRLPVKVLFTSDFLPSDIPSDGVRWSSALNWANILALCVHFGERRGALRPASALHLPTKISYNIAMPPPNY